MAWPPSLRLRYGGPAGASRHHGRGKCLSRHQHRGASQTRMLFRGDSDDVGAGGGRRERALRERRSDGAVDEVPRRGDLASDEATVGINDVHDAAEAEAEVPGGRVQRGTGFAVTTSRACDEVLDGERTFGGNVDRTAEVARQRL